MPVSLELGGKSPLIINKDADIDAAVETAHFALFFNREFAPLTPRRLAVRPWLWGGECPQQRLPCLHLDPPDPPLPAPPDCRRPVLLRRQPPVRAR